MLRRVAALVFLMLVLASPVGAQNLEQPPGSQANVSNVRRNWQVARTQLVALTAKQQALSQTYHRQLSDLDKLKGGRASWRRDRLVADKKQELQKTAETLAVIDGQISGLRKDLAARQKQLVGAIEVVLRSGTLSPQERRALENERAALATSSTRKIVLPDEALNPFADPEELAEQISLLKRAEAQLLHEESQLASRANQFRRLADLRAVRNRASELRDSDDDVVRRAGGGGGDEKTGAAADNGNAPLDPQAEAGAPQAGESDGVGDFHENGGGGGVGGGNDLGGLRGDTFESSAIALSDILDGASLKNLQNASQSRDPAIRAQLAQKALQALKNRIELLRRNRAAIENHLRKVDH